MWHQSNRRVDKLIRREQGGDEEVPGLSVGLRAGRGRVTRVENRVDRVGVAPANIGGSLVAWSGLHEH